MSSIAGKEAYPGEPACSAELRRAADDGFRDTFQVILCRHPLLSTSWAMSTQLPLATSQWDMHQLTVANQTASSLTPPVSCVQVEGCIVAQSLHW